VLTLPEGMRHMLREPFGTLIRDADVTGERLRSEIPDGALVVAVGDATTERLARLGMPAGVEVVDGQERRAARAAPRGSPATSLSCKNAAGTIAGSALAALREALSSPRPVRLTVDGEEDLLAVPLCEMCEDGTVVAYGQPGEGMVVVRVGAGPRDRARRIMKMMGRRDDEPVAG